MSKNFSQPKNSIELNLDENQYLTLEVLGSICRQDSNFILNVAFACYVAKNQGDNMHPFAYWPQNKAAWQKVAGFKRRKLKVNLEKLREPEEKQMAKLDRVFVERGNFELCPRKIQQVLNCFTDWLGCRLELNDKHAVVYERESGG